MTKLEFLQNLYITKEEGDTITLTFNDERNYCFIHLKTKFTNLVNAVFTERDPSWSYTRQLQRLIREEGTISNEMRYPIRYPIAIK